MPKYTDPFAARMASDVGGTPAASEPGFSLEAASARNRINPKEMPTSLPPMLSSEPSREKNPAQSQKEANATANTRGLRRDRARKVAEAATKSSRAKNGPDALAHTQRISSDAMAALRA